MAMVGTGSGITRAVLCPVPDVPTPAGLVEALGRGPGRRVLCPVPDVVGLRELPVVPGFLAGLEAAGWVAVRAPTYMHRSTSAKAQRQLRITGASNRHPTVPVGQ
ncbi:hypothetical protein E2562_030875 [Oryza meyeriana var. granulata]|uniref:Uncharacterized protein n=1 Tax=Oryza meyeriana var. granulata TaxID=110450 RepID=A0A6G1F035_9ORYZ|nr:hypothetical protein E2562_030875 [Oryza meyeriana var. granulata]